MIPRATPIPIPAAAPDDIPELDEPEDDESGEEVEVEVGAEVDPEAELEAEVTVDPDCVAVEPDWAAEVGSCFHGSLDICSRLGRTCAYVGKGR